MVSTAGCPSSAPSITGLYDRDWVFDPGEGRDNLNSHYFYTIDARMDRGLADYLNEKTFDDTIVILEREIEVWDPEARRWIIARVQVPNTTIIEEPDGSHIEQHTEILTYNYGINPAQINIHYFDSRFMDGSEYKPVTMNFRVVFMWP